MKTMKECNHQFIEWDFLYDGQYSTRIVVGKSFICINCGQVREVYYDGKVVKIQSKFEKHSVILENGKIIRKKSEEVTRDTREADQG